MRLFTVIFTLCAAVLLRAQPVPFSAETATAQLTQALQEHFRAEGELQLELLRPWTAPNVTAREWQVQVAEFPASLASSILLRVRVLADGRVVSEQTHTARAALWREAWASKSPITAGTTFDVSSLETRRIDALRDRDALPAQIGDGSYIFNRGVSSARLLTWRDIARRPLVRKGETVEVSATDGQLVLTLKGIAQQNGAQGDAVTVRNPDSRKDFTAYVIDENRVQVRF